MAVSHGRKPLDIVTVLDVQRQRRKLVSLMMVLLLLMMVVLLLLRRRMASMRMSRTTIGRALVTRWLLLGLRLVWLLLMMTV